MVLNFINSEGCLISPYSILNKPQFLKLDKNNSILWGKKKTIQTNCIANVRDKYLFLKK